MPVRTCESVAELSASRISFWLAATVTVCGTFQFSRVKVRVSRDTVTRSSSGTPGVTVTVTVTGADGGFERLTM